MLERANEEKGLPIRTQRIRDTRESIRDIEMQHEESHAEYPS
jgi:hypothetical protein